MRIDEGAILYEKRAVLAIVSIEELRTGTKVIRYAVAHSRQKLWRLGHNPTNAPLGGRTIVLWGPPGFVIKCCDLRRSLVTLKLIKPNPRGPELFDLSSNLHERASAVALAIAVAIAVRVAAQIDIVIRQVALELEPFEAGRDDIARASCFILCRRLGIFSGR
jgi:hypothetical protein